METRLQHLIEIDRLIKRAKSRAFDRKRSAVFYKKIGFSSMARELLAAHFTSAKAAQRLQTYFNNKLKGLANEL